MTSNLPLKYPSQLLPLSPERLPFHAHPDLRRPRLLLLSMQ